MLAVYVVLMVCTMAPVIALQAGADTSVLIWMVLALIVVKAALLVDHFMEMRKAPIAWRFGVQAWAPLVVSAIAVIHWAS